MRWQDGQVDECMYDEKARPCTHVVLALTLANRQLANGQQAHLGTQKTRLHVLIGTS